MHPRRDSSDVPIFVRLQAHVCSAIISTYFARFLTSQDTSRNTLDHVFQDPLPAGYILRNVQLTLVGCYNCIVSKDRYIIPLPTIAIPFAAYISSALASVSIGVIEKDFTLPLGPGFCYCKNCHYPVVLPAINGAFQWWPGPNLFRPLPENSLLYWHHKTHPAVV